MPRYNIWVNKDNNGAFSREENKSGLINTLLARHYAILPKTSSPRAERPSGVEAVESVQDKQQLNERLKKASGLDLCKHGAAHGMCKYAGCNKKGKR